jgi:hypothetical protein
MQQWEYLYVYVGGYDWIDSVGRGGKLSTVTTQRFKNGVFFPVSLSNELGEQGWELGGVTGQSSTYTLIFKRPKPGDAR